jgi:hypothetical protein
MRLTDKLQLVADWLVSEENDLLVNAETNEDSLFVIADALVKAAQPLLEAAKMLENKSAVEEPYLTTEQLTEIAEVAEAFDESEDEFLKKKASVLDEILLTFAAPKNTMYDLQRREDSRIDELKKRYKQTKEDQDKSNKVADSVKEIEKSQVYKQFKPQMHELSTRYCPEPGHAGVLAVRVGESVVQCVLDKKIYDYASGFILADGTKVPGAGVENQTALTDDPNHSAHTIFDSRSQRLGLDSESNK